MTDKLTPEEKAHITQLNENIKQREKEIELKEWKKAFDELADFTRRNIGCTDLFHVIEKINELRPKKNK